MIVRGNHRQKTFLNESDYQAYLERLGRYRKRLAVTVYAYCLMPNHVPVSIYRMNNCGKGGIHENCRNRDP